MNALIVLDVQKGILKKKDFSETLNNIKILIDDFKMKNDIVILTKHLSDDHDSPILKAPETRKYGMRFKGWAVILLKRRLAIHFTKPILHKS